MLRGKLKSLLVASAMIAGALVVVGAPSASAATSGCIDLGFSPLNTSTSTGYFDSRATLRTHPYATCGSMGTYPAGTNFDVWCYNINQHGNKWFYVRIAGTEIKGWLYEGPAVLWGLGTTRECPFPA